MRNLPPHKFTRRAVFLTAALAAGRGEAAQEPARTVRDFGAAGDGRSDDTAALQKAIDSGAGAIRLPAGRYRIVRPLRVDLDRIGPVSIQGEGGPAILMAGAGPAILVLGTHTTGSAAPATFRPNVWERQRTPALEGFEIVGAHPQSDGVRLEGTMQATLSRLSIRATRHAIHLTGRNRNVIISACHFYDNRGVGVLLEKVNLHQINIVGCHISYNGGGGIVVRGSEVRNIQIGTCDIESNMSKDGPPAANVLFDSTEGSVTEGALVGCTVQHNSESPGSANVRFIGRGAGDATRVGNFSIANNAFSDVMMNIHLRYARGIAITGNTFWKGYQHNLLVEGCSDIQLGINNFDRNPAYKSPDSRNGLLFVDSSDCTLSGVHINHTVEAEAGLILRRCRRFNVTGCTILDCDKAGILLDDARSVRVSNCLIRHDRSDATGWAAIKAVGGADNMIAGNLVNGPLEVPEGSGWVEGNRTASQKPEVDIRDR